MDLGFGNVNQIVGDVAARALLQSARAQESVLDDQLAQYDSALRTNLTDNSSTTSILDQLRAKRLKELQQAHIEQQQWQAAGHGAYRELEASPQHAGDVAKAFFAVAKESDRVVLHFYRPTSPYCDSVHAHLTQLAAKHVETRFCKLNVDGCENSSNSGSGAAFLVQHFGIHILPTLVLIQQRRVVHHVRGFNEVLQIQMQMQEEQRGGGGSRRRPLGQTMNETEPSVAALERVLLQHGVIRGPPAFEEKGENNNDDDVDDDDVEEKYRPKTTMMMRSNNKYRTNRGGEETDDFD